MKKFSRNVLILCGGAFMVALICFGAGFLFGGSPKQIGQMIQDGELSYGDSDWYDFWDRCFGGYRDAESQIITESDEGTGANQSSASTDGADSANYTTAVDESYMASTIQNMDIDLHYGEVDIVESDSDTITVKVQADSSYRFSCEQDGDTVKLKDEKKDSNKKHAYITIAIPKDHKFDEFKLDTNAGAVTSEVAFAANDMELNLDAGELIASNLTVADSLDVEVGAGHAALSEIQCGEVSLNCGMGEIDLDGTVAGDVDSECGMGNITLKLNGEERDYDYELKCGVGAIKLNDSTYSSLGNSQKIDNGSDRKMSLDCGAGEIDVTIRTGGSSAAANSNADGNTGNGSNGTANGNNGNTGNGSNGTVNGNNGNTGNGSNGTVNGNNGNDANGNSSGNTHNVSVNHENDMHDSNDTHNSNDAYHE